MKSLRKSLNGNKDSLRSQISTPLPLPPVSKPPSAILPPQKVIRALSAYRPQAPQELPFKKGDFFYVLRDVDDQGAWYEAHNPVSGARGLVPRSMFEEFNKNAAPIRTSQVGGKGLPPLQTRPDPPAGPGSPKSQVFYAIVLHDFVAERADELDAKRGDPITVVAQSNREWFVAKPIGRLGRPGLIPVSFVEIHDPATGKAIPDVEALMDRGDLPKVEDWKRAMFNYKQNSIALGVIDSPNRDSVPNSPYMPQHSPLAPPLAPPSEPSVVVQGPSPKKPSHTNTDPPRLPTPDFLADGILLSANVVSFHYEMEEYWFRVDAVFQPYGPLGQRKLPPAKQLILFRVYNDFYDFQVALLDTFPREAGRQPPNPRMLPYMPGPAQNVDDALTATRRSELDEYVRKLCDLNLAGAKYILEHRVVREFLALKPGDVENDAEPRVEEMEALFGYGFSGQEEFMGVADDFGSEVRDTLGRMRVQDREEDEKSDGSEYEDEGYAPSPQRRAHDHDHHPYANERRPSNNDSSSQNNLRLHAHAQNHQRTGSSASNHRATSPYSTNSRSSSPLPDRTNSPRPLRNYSPQRSGPARAPLETDSRAGEYPYPQPRRNDNTGKNYPASTPSTSSLRSSQAQSTSGRSHTQSTTVASNPNNPPISAANPQTSFVKIKIFDRVADDLIAIRVHPRVTHGELMDKVQARLGGEVANLRYRDSMSNAFVGINGDEDLRAWMEGTNKHVLFAD